MNPSSPNHHQQPTRSVTAAGHRHRIEAQTGWNIKKFVRDARSNRIVKTEADNQTRTAADPLPDNLGKALFMIRADVRTNVSQAGAVAGQTSADDAEPVTLDFKVQPAHTSPSAVR
jgi:hypothetical protein